MTESGVVRSIDLGKETLQDWLNRIKLNTTPSLFPDMEKIASNGLNFLTQEDFSKEGGECVLKVKKLD